MNKHLVLLFSLFLTCFSIGQSRIDTLVILGIQYHGEGEYDKAIRIYQSALELEPNSPLVNYEIAFSYMMKKDYHRSLYHIDKVIEADSLYLIHAYTAKGSCLNYLGKTDEAIETFLYAIDKLGDNNMLYFNLAIAYQTLSDFVKAKDVLIQSILNNPYHASSHLQLGYTMQQLNSRVQSLLSLYYFLLLEPHTLRSAEAYNNLAELWNAGIDRKNGSKTDINIYINPEVDDPGFTPVDLALSMFTVKKTIEESEGKTDEDLFVEQTEYFFTILGELKKEEHKGLWWEFYIPLFYKLALTEHIETFCYYISQTKSTEAIDWLDNNNEKAEKFFEWLNNN